MEIFFATDSDGTHVYLDQEESAHCLRVLRHRTGDEVSVVDGHGNMFLCRLEDDNPKGATGRIISKSEGWNSHPYILDMAVCPTKNNERYEWFAEKAVEIGVDGISPVIGERSERKVFKTERLKRIVLSAMKQSLKAELPLVKEPCTVREYIERSKGLGGLKLFACCFDGECPRRSIVEVLQSSFPKGRMEGLPEGPSKPGISILIGPEGDFSPEEASLALDGGFIPVHLGGSRLRTETAAVAAAAACYFHFM